MLDLDIISPEKSKEFSADIEIKRFMIKLKKYVL